MKIICNTKNGELDKVLAKLKRLGYKWHGGDDLSHCCEWILSYDVVAIYTYDDGMYVTWGSDTSGGYTPAEDFIARTFTTKTEPYIIMTKDRKKIYGLTQDGCDEFIPLDKFDGCFASPYSNTKTANMVAAYHQKRLGEELVVVKVKKTVKLVLEEDFD